MGTASEEKIADSLYPSTGDGVYCRQETQACHTGAELARLNSLRWPCAKVSFPFLFLSPCFLLLMKTFPDDP